MKGFTNSRHAETLRVAVSASSKKGFTLIELLVVVLIIGILSAVALPQYRVAVAKSRYVQLMALTHSFKKAEEIYFMANGTYTFSFEDLDIGVPAGWEFIQQGGFTILRSPDGKKQCTLQDGSGNGTLLTVYCRANNLMYYLHINGERLCRPLNSDVTAARVCKSLGGVPLSSASDSYYRLP